jgi:hypothetical protein
MLQIALHMVSHYLKKIKRTYMTHPIHLFHTQQSNKFLYNLAVTAYKKNSQMYSVFVLKRIFVKNIFIEY